MKILAIIPARGGSKGVPKKNIKLLAGKPLITYSIEAAKRSVLIDKVVVSTDSTEIAEISRKNGVLVTNRPPELARDDSLVINTVRHALTQQKMQYDLVVLLEPTSPFRTPADIDDTITLLTNEKADSAATFSETDVPPTRIWKIEHNTPSPFMEGADPFLPRQQQSKGYALNGMVYVLKTKILKKYPEATSFMLGTSVAHIIPSRRVVDIDTEQDFIFAEWLLNHT